MLTGGPKLEYVSALFTFLDGIKSAWIKVNLTLDLIFTCVSSTRALGLHSSLKNLNFHQRACWPVLDYRCAEAKAA